VLPDERLGEPTMRFEVSGDSVRRWTPARTTAEPYQSDRFYEVGSTPYAEVAFVKYLLGQPSRAAKLSGGDSASLHVVREMDVPTAHGTERVRLVAITRNAANTPWLLWI